LTIDCQHRYCIRLQLSKSYATSTYSRTLFRSIHHPLFGVRPRALQ
jgi:hypothetical protein